jgi:hypothetical protein
MRIYMGGRTAAGYTGGNEVCVYGKDCGGIYRRRGIM